FLDDSFSQLNFASRALPRAKTGSGAAADEASADPTVAGKPAILGRPCQLQQWHYNFSRIR
ncbi:MAG: hypothetical protein KJ651_06650, partial [Gammaproteobacteria bacterium]|nr:hypothetical protein [Gammaproteobacteria bacterium]